MATDHEDFAPPKPRVSHVWIAFFAIMMVLWLFIYVDDGELSSGLMTVSFSSMLADALWRRHFADRRRVADRSRELPVRRFHSRHRPNIQRQ